jgi:hypothetical protein
MILAGACMVGPVAADTTGTTAITGNPAAEIAITVNTSANEILLVQGATNSQDALIVNVKANPIGWRLSVHDDMTANGVKPGTYGHMQNWTTAIWSTDVTELISPMYIRGSAGTNAIQAPEVNLGTGGSGVDQTLETGTAATATLGNDYIMTTRQPVQFNDRSLASPNVYRLVLMFTGTTL